MASPRLPSSGQSFAFPSRCSELLSCRTHSCSFISAPSWLWVKVASGSTWYRRRPQCKALCSHSLLAFLCREGTPPALTLALAQGLPCCRKCGTDNVGNWCQRYQARHKATPQSWPDWQVNSGTPLYPPTQPHICLSFWAQAGPMTTAPRHIARV